MLRYEVHQFHLEDLGRFFLPLPKLNQEQLTYLGRDLERRGYGVARNGTIKAHGQGARFTLNPSGLASSPEELLDSVVPSIGKVLHFPSEVSGSNPYFAAKKKGDHLEIQFFPRMEGLKIWNSLRRNGECGLTPDEALVIGLLLRDSKRRVDCVSDYPTETSVPLLIGKRQYYSSSMPPEEFLSNLRTLTHRSVRNCYLPKSSLIQIDKDIGPILGPGLDLGEWCFLRFASQNQ